MSACLSDGILILFWDCYITFPGQLVDLHEYLPRVPSGLYHYEMVFRMAFPLPVLLIDCSVGLQKKGDVVVPVTYPYRGFVRPTLLTV